MAAAVSSNSAASRTESASSAKNFAAASPLLLQTPGEEGHEGRIEGPLGKGAPEQVGQPEGDEKGIRHRSRPHHVGDQGYPGRTPICG